jgi:hypothetical protein
VKASRRKGTGPHTARERDLIDLLKHIRERERRLLNALVVIATRGDAKVLAAMGTVLDFAVTSSCAEATARPRARRRRNSTG